MSSKYNDTSACSEDDDDEICEEMKRLGITYDDLPLEKYSVKNDCYMCRAKMKDGKLCNNKIYDSQSYGRIYCGHHRSSYLLACDHRDGLKKCSHKGCQNRLRETDEFSKCENCRSSVNKHDHKRYHHRNQKRKKYLLKYNKTSKSKTYQKTYAQDHIVERREYMREYMRRRRGSKV
jgi:hypothetical protein